MGRKRYGFTVHFSYNLCSELMNGEVRSYTARGKIDLCPDLLLLVSEEKQAAISVTKALD